MFHDYGLLRHKSKITDKSHRSYIGGHGGFMIKIEHLVKNYGSICAVDDISFSVEKGEIVGFLGPNGAGKSTTMNMLTGYLSSTSGTIHIADYEVLENPREAKKLVGYLPEQPPLYADMTVAEYLSFCFDLKECKFNKKEHIREICEVVKIEDVYNRVIKNLSKGYRQRVGIAQALIGNPEVIIFDEPTVGLDPKQIIEIRNLIRTLGKDHTVILSTHVLSEVQAVCDRIIIINKGKIVANELTENINRAVQSNRRFNVKICGPQREVLAALKAIPGMTYAEVLPERDGDAYLYTIESEVGTDVRKRLFTTIAERGWIMIGLEALGMSLEDIFINVVEDELIAPEENAKKPKATSRRKYDYESRNREIGRDIARQLRENASATSSGENTDGDNA